MSEFEAIEAVTALLENGMTSFTVYFSFTFAYLTASYLVAAALTKFQAIALSALYVVSAESTGVAVYGCQQAIEDIQNTYPSAVIDSMLIWDMRYWHAYILFLFIAVIILSLYFMYNRRRQVK